MVRRGPPNLALPLFFLGKAPNFNSCPPLRASSRGDPAKTNRANTCKAIKAAVIVATGKKATLVAAVGGRRVPKQPGRTNERHK